MILQSAEQFGIRLDEERNALCSRREGMISNPDSPIQVWVVPTNEEIIVARECALLLGASQPEAAGRR
jgi:acetate kinase